MSFLADILRHKRTEVSLRKSSKRRAEFNARISERDSSPRPLEAVLRRPPGSAPRLLAEIKKASPSKGLIRASFDPVEIARVYHRAGADALSVLTDQRFFQGDLDFLRLVREALDLPLLQKDFIVDEFQVYEACAWGADAVLLIVAALEDGQIEEYLHLARELGLSALVEVHHEKELERIAETASLIGINNRDLATFEIDLATTERVMREMPAGRVVVSESGLASRDDVQRVAAAGIDAVLIGETFMRARDIGAKVQELMASSSAEPSTARKSRS